ncbi:MULTISPECIES: ABC transporter permease [Auritidibacter]|uniref:ABC transporter permease n=1 Tax=Auritidibacter TaxID=1160973 RepID=UPI000D72D0B4|nr:MULTISPECIES: ABC transporter permease [Auritidibacter]AXR73081.1 ABC transporter permease [Auritidibacter sp. NML130574]NIH71514.1 ABC-2 type transport system permease protein [Auritidibacter ignavus]PXA81835.1 ABC transporter permease [Auritidibacter sp. NML120636]RMX22508.1 ABC transporter permease [Auritidibacter ignavus]WGH81621.1 ABC transporter permease [Auritidibacter ignavus]
MTAIASHTTTKPSHGGSPARSTLSIFVHYLAWDTWRSLRMWESTFFILVLPAMLYLMFGVAGDVAELNFGDGNMTAWVMTSMACYGSVIAATAVSSSAVVEKQHGWNRVLALTGLSNPLFMVSKMLMGMILAILPTTLILILGATTGAEFDTVGHWIATAALTIVGTIPFVFYGLAVAMIFRAQSAVAIGSGFLVVLAFLGNLFIPLSGTLLEIGRFTPMYGTGQLAHYPQAEGLILDQEAFVTGEFESDSLAWILGISLAWTVIFAGLCWLSTLGSTRR